MRKFLAFVFAFYILSVFPTHTALADTIILNDGRKIKGTITEEGSDYYKVKIKIGTMKINKGMVKEIKKLAAEENFLILGNQYLASNNLDAAIEQYRKSLRANPDYQPAKDALAKAEKMKSDVEAKKKAELEERQRQIAERMEKVKKGFGFTIESSDGRIILSGVAADSKADAAGLKAADEIIRINDLETKGKSADEITGYLTEGENRAYSFTIQKECELIRKKINYQKHSFVGVGVFVDSAGDDLVINSVIVGEPADLAGLKSKDRIISIDEKPVSGMSVDEASDLIGGPESSKLRMVIQRSVELERK